MKTINPRQFPSLQALLLPPLYEPRLLIFNPNLNPHTRPESITIRIGTKRRTYRFMVPMHDFAIEAALHDRRAYSRLFAAIRGYSRLKKFRSMRLTGSLECRF